MALAALVDAVDSASESLLAFEVRLCVRVLIRAIRLVVTVEGDKR
jgi:hypothetical protein